MTVGDQIPYRFVTKALRERLLLVMIERISLRLYLTCMVLCASTVLVAIWFGPDKDPEWFKLMPTLFIIGFGSFQVWAVCMVYRFLVTSK